MSQEKNQTMRNQMGITFIVEDTWSGVGEDCDWEGWRKLRVFKFVKKWWEVGKILCTYVILHGKVQCMRIES